MLSETKISSENSTVIPSPIRRKFGISPGDILQWDVDKDKIQVTPRKKVTLDDIVGMISVGGDAVKSKKQVQRGEL